MLSHGFGIGPESAGGIDMLRLMTVPTEKPYVLWFLAPTNQDAPLIAIPQVM